MNLSEVNKLDPKEMVQGYRDGRAGKQAESMSDAYQHGWANGIADRTGEIDSDQRKLAYEYHKQGGIAEPSITGDQESV